MPFIQHSQPETEERDPEMTHANQTKIVDHGDKGTDRINLPDETAGGGDEETKDDSPSTSAYEASLKAQMKAVREAKRLFAGLDATARAALVSFIVETYGAK